MHNTTDPAFTPGDPAVPMGAATTLTSTSATRGARGDR